ncbi:IS66 family transposase [Deltaproteobacteria bacterium TL4]
MNLLESSMLLNSSSFSADTSLVMPVMLYSLWGLFDEKRELKETKINLEEKIKRLEAENQKLRDQLAKNSSNSSKPPSSDGLKKAQKTKSLRKKGEKKNGGQEGHEGNTLQMSESPQETEKLEVNQCEKCGSSLKDKEALFHERRQVFDIPPIEMVVKEYQAEIKICPCCDHTNKAIFPEGVNQPVQYGPRLRSFASYFNQYHFIALDRTCQVMEDLFGQKIAQGTLLKANEDLAVELLPFREETLKQLIASNVVNFDESGLRVINKLHWLHVARTETLTLYHVDPKRGQEAMDSMGILPEFEGTAVHDHWKSYFNYEQASHSLCNAHHLRELEFIVNQYSQDWATEMGDLLCEINQQVEDHKLQGLNALENEQRERFSQQYDQILQKGFQANPELPLAKDSPKKRGKKKQTPPKNLLDRLSSFKKETLAFMNDFELPFSNNAGERDIRMIKVKQKVSGCFRTLEGAETFCIIRSYISTVRKNGISVIDVLQNAFLKKTWIPSPIP